MPYAVQSHLAARVANRLQVGRIERVPLGAEVPGRDEAEAPLDLEEILDPLDPGTSLHVVGQDEGEPGFPRPQIHDW